MLYDELDNYEKCKDLPKQRPNSMNDYGVVLNYIGLEPFITDLCDNFLNIIAEWMFPFKDTNFTYFGTLDHHHTFTVEYELNGDIFLDMHVDDSEITFNINLFDQFYG
ncbi:MAG: hypothetical protein GY755_02255, partial [Chloroflexi bacterium]|nr:hypothetical protein [Chloroflexota bacterium]